MAEEPTTTTPVATATVEVGEQPETDLGDAGKKAIAAERAAKKAAEKQLADLQKRLQEFEDRDKSEAQKLAERAAAAEQERDALMLTAMRQRVALEKGIPAALADRLQGASEDEMRADAESLLALMPSATRPRPDPDQGVRGSSLALNGDGLEQALRSAVGAP